MWPGSRRSSYSPFNFTLHGVEAYGGYGGLKLLKEIVLLLLEEAENVEDQSKTYKSELALDDSSMILDRVLTRWKAGRTALIALSFRKHTKSKTWRIHVSAKESVTYAKRVRELSGNLRLLESRLERIEEKREDHKVVGDRTTVWAVMPCLPCSSTT